MLYDSSALNLISCCPTTPDTTTPKITTVSTTITTTSNEVPGALETSSPHHENFTPTGNDSAKSELSLRQETVQDDDSNFSSFHIGAIVGTSLASVVVTLIIVAIALKLRHKQERQDPAASNVRVAADARDNNEEHEDYSKASPAYGYTYVHTSTDRQPHSLPSVKKALPDAEHYIDIDNHVGLSTKVGTDPDSYTEVNKRPTINNGGDEDGDESAGKDASGHYYNTISTAERVEHDSPSPYSRLGEEKVVMVNVYDQFQTDTQ